MNPNQTESEGTGSQTEVQSEVDQVGWIEARAVYAIDHATDTTIEQFFELTGPLDNKPAVKQIIADHTGRTTRSIEEMEIIDQSEREQIEDSGIVYQESPLQLGGV